MTIDLSRFDHWVIMPYGMCLFAGIILGLVYVAVRLRQAGMKAEHIFYVIFINFISILGFGNLVSAMMFFELPFKAGFTSLGGAVGLFAGVILCSFIFKEKRGEIQRACVTALPLIYAITKLGCLFGGCCGGLAYTGPFAIRYTRGAEILCDYAIPVPVIETIVFLGLFLFFIKREKTVSVCGMILLCGMMKFLLDFLRDTHTDAVITRNQIGCLVIMVSAAVFYAKQGRADRLKKTI